MRYYGLEKVKAVEPYCFWLRSNCQLSEDPNEHLFLIGYLTDMTLGNY
jgi:acyl-CoA thioesterase